VSTILKALRKLEREKEAALRAAGPVPVVGAPGPAHGGASGWSLKPWLLWSLAVVLIVVLGGTPWHLYRQSLAYAPRLAERSGAREHQPDRRLPDVQEQAVSPPHRNAVKPEPRAIDRSSPSGRLTAGRQPTARPPLPRRTGVHEGSRQPAEPSRPRIPGPPLAQERPAVAQTTPPTVPAGPAGGTSPGSTPERNRTAGSQPALKESTQVLPASVVSSEKPDAASKAPASSDAYDKTPALTDGRLRVHAIAWSPQPEERMAVINSRVIHEGDSVEDFVIVAIRTDDVVVREKGKGVWRVEFGRP
jgi:hypothetical protein